MDDLGHLYTLFHRYVGNVCSAGSCLVALLHTWTAIYFRYEQSSSIPRSMDIYIDDYHGANIR